MKRTKFKKMKPKFNKKAIVLTLGLATLTLPLDAQVFYNRQHQSSEKENKTDGSLMHRSSDGGGFFIHPQTFFDGENYGYNLFNGTFEDVTPEMPLGSGLFIMAAAGAGYALKKRKDNKKQ